MNDTDKRIVDGFLFENEKDYREALREKEGIKYLNSQIDLNNAEKTLAVYKDILHKKIFRTQVGIRYLEKLRESLVLKGMEDIPPITVQTYGSSEADIIKDNKSDEIKESHEYKRLDKLYKKKTENLRTSFIINIVLAIVIAAMFIISSTSSSPTILNYREKIEDSYAQWDSELKERDAEIRERERAVLEKEQELGMMGDDSGSQN